MKLIIDTFGGNCPVQAEGSVDGDQFYFRARGDGWEFRVNNGAWIKSGDYGIWPDAGWMPEIEAKEIIKACATEYSERVQQR